MLSELRQGLGDLGKLMHENKASTLLAILLATCYHSTYYYHYDSDYYYYFDCPTLAI